MKRFLCLLLIIAMSAMLFACAGAKLTAKPNVVTDPTEETTTVAPTEETTDPFFEEDFFEDEFGADTDAAMNAIAAALNGTGISQSNLQSMLEAEGYSMEAVISAIGSANVDWNAQAALAGKNAMVSDPATPSALKDLLLSEGFTDGQADYGVANCGDWNAYALAYARQHYANLEASEVESQLIVDGFTAAQAAYAAKNI